MTRQLTTISGLSDPREAAFVTAIFDMGGPQHAAAAALRAGYARDLDEAGRVAVHLLSAPRIASTIAGESQERFKAASAAAFRALVDICANGRSESARISAAQEILNRSIGPIPSRSESIVAHASVEDMIAHLDGSPVEHSPGSPQEKTDTLAGVNSGPPTIEHDPSNAATPQRGEPGRESPATAPGSPVEPLNPRSAIPS